MRILLVLIFGLIISMSAVASDFALTSKNFTEGNKIPELYTCNGKNISPELSWKNPPAKTQGYVLILSCPDAPVGMFYNWVIYNIPATLQGLPEGASDDLPDGVMTGENSIEDAIYRGPCPPDDLIHHYIFTLYAVDTQLDLSPDEDVNVVLAILKRHTLQKTQLMGVFNH